MERYWIVYLVLLVKTAEYGVINIHDNVYFTTNNDEHFSNEIVTKVFSETCGIEADKLLSIRITGFSEFADVLDFNTFITKQPLKQQQPVVEYIQ
jgi:uncharacterized pyridoxamine 5'-phosphate oxidase family protein